MFTFTPTRDVIFDARCLQDPLYAERGVGQHARALVEHMPQAPDLRKVALTTVTLPPMAPAIAALFHSVFPNAYAAMQGRPTAFVGLSPMTHSPLDIAPLLLAPDLPSVAVVYDFIPWAEPERYLAQAGDRLDYHTALAWLSRYDHFAPISQASADDLRQMIGMSAARVGVTGAPLSAAFEPQLGITSWRRRHVLVVGGGDARKNPECAIRAHARSVDLQRQRVPLVLCGYRADALPGFQSVAVTSGGDAALVEVPGHVSEASLVQLYRDALCVVAPSRAEGFSLPVIEGMACSVPVFTSDIAAHSELVRDPALRFAPDDDARLESLLNVTRVDRRFRSQVIAAQAPVWPLFRAVEVARRFWSPLHNALVGNCIQAPAVARGAKPRVAMLTPLPPDQSGVADYSAETCESLGQLVDLHVLTPTRVPKPIQNVTSIQPLDSKPMLRGDFDRVVTVMGNSHFHSRIFEHQLRYGGACIAHDSRMLSFYAVLLGQERACQVAAAELGRDVTPTDLAEWLADEGRLPALFLGEIADSAAPTIMHTSVTERMVATRHNIIPRHLPFSTSRRWQSGWLSGRQAARERLHLADDEVVIATFGFAHSTKAPYDCVWALETLRGWGINASLHFVGHNALWEHDLPLRRLIKLLGLVPYVRMPETYVSRQTYDDYLLGADLGIQLRTYGLGALSAGLLDCAAAGLPSVANAALAEAVEVPSYVKAIPDALSPVLLARALAELHAEGSRVQHGSEARAFCEARSFDVYAKGLVRLLDLDVGTAAA